MSKVIEIRLSDAQHAALTAAIEASGEKFFDYCRNRLMAGTHLPTIQAAPPARVEEQRAYFRQLDRHLSPSLGGGAKPDRLDRLEALVMRLAEAVEGRAATETEEPIADGDVDIDDVVDQSLNEAEQAGLTRMAEQTAAPSHGVRHVGTRPRMPYTGPAPAHLRGIS